VRFLWHTTDDEEINKMLEDPAKIIVNRYPGLKKMVHKDQFQLLMSMGSKISEGD